MQALVERMVAAMRAAPGVGLTAPQLGVPLRVFLMEDTASRMQRLTPQEIAERERVPVLLRVVFNPGLRGRLRQSWNINRRRTCSCWMLTPGSW